MAQVFTADNVAVGPAFIVPTYTGTYLVDSDWYPQPIDLTAVAIARDGTFVVVWQGPSDDFGTGIHMRMYSATGTPLTGQNRVNILDAAYFREPSISMRYDKTFIITWRKSITGSTSPKYTICGQRYTAAGVKTGVSSFQINQVTTSSVLNTDVGVADDGSFIVVWDYYSSADSGYVPMGRRFNSSGTALTNEFKVNATGSYYAGVQQLGTRPRVAVAPGGRFSVVWHADVTTAVTNIYCQLYWADCTPYGSQFQVNDVASLMDRLYPDVACDRDGNFTVVWQMYGYSTSGYGEMHDDPITLDYGIFGRLFDVNGVAKTGDLYINNPNYPDGRAIGAQTFPSVTRSDGSGKFVAAWGGYQGTAPSGGIQGVWHSDKWYPTPLPTVTFTLTAPTSGSYVAGSIVPATWWATGIQAGYTVNLGYITSSDWSGVQHWISVGEIYGSNGSTTWNWDTTGVPPGTYYMIGYVWNGGTGTYSHVATTFRII
jgi:hypothetical protein